MKFMIFILTLHAFPILSNTITVITSRSSSINISVNGALCLTSQNLGSFQSTAFNSCTYSEGDFIEINVNSLDFINEPGFSAYFTLSDAFGVIYSFATNSDWFCNYFSASVVDSLFQTSLNGFNPKPNWIWDPAKSQKIVCYNQVSYFHYLKATINVDNFFDAFEVKNANGVSKYRWESNPRESGSGWSSCRDISISLIVENGDYIYIEGGADTSSSDSLLTGGTGMNALITIIIGPDSYNMITTVGSEWLCADNTNKSTWGANNGGSVGVWLNSVYSTVPNYCNLGTSIWNSYSMYAVCKHQVMNLPN